MEGSIERAEPTVVSVPAVPKEPLLRRTSGLTFSRDFAYIGVRSNGWGWQLHDCRTKIGQGKKPAGIKGRIQRRADIVGTLTRTSL